MQVRLTMMRALTGLRRTLSLTVLVVVLHGATAWAAGPVTVPLNQASFGDLVVDDANQHVFESAPAQNKVLVFDFNGNSVATIQNLPGADGMVIEGSSLYVAESTTGTIEAINLATLADGGPVATGLTDPQSIAFAGGELWTTESPVGVSGQIASVTLGGTVTAFPLRYFYPEQLATSAATPDVLYAYAGGGVEKLDVSTGSPVLAGSAAPGQGSGGELAISPDGTRLISADSAGTQPLAAVEVSATSLGADGIEYPIIGLQTLADAVSPGDGGLVALGLQEAGAGVNPTNIEVFQVGDPNSFLDLSTGSSNGQSNDLQDVESNGLAMSADGSRLFAVVSTSIYRNAFNLVTFNLGAALAGAPVELGGPSISGTPETGQTLQIDPGSWQGATAFTYDWWECRTGCMPVSVNYESSTLGLTTADTNQQIFAYVTAVNSSSSVTSYTAKTSAVAQEPVPSLTVVPSVSGTAQIGYTLTATSGTWTNSPTAYQYQWLRSSSAGWTSIAGATGSSYVATAADVGSSLEVQVTASNYGGAGTAALSAPTAVLASPQAPVSQTPTTPQRPTTPQPPPQTTKTTGTSPGSVAAIKTDLAHMLKPSGKTAAIASVLKRRGYMFSFKAPALGKLTLTWTATVGHKKVTIGDATLTIPNAHTVNAVLRLTAQGAWDLRHDPDLRITAEASFKSPNLSRLVATKRFRLT